MGIIKGPFTDGFEYSGFAGSVWHYGANPAEKYQQSTIITASSVGIAAKAGTKVARHMVAADGVRYGDGAGQSKLFLMIGPGSRRAPTNADIKGSYIYHYYFPSNFVHPRGNTTNIFQWKQATSPSTAGNEPTWWIEMNYYGALKSHTDAVWAGAKPSSDDAPVAYIRNRNQRQSRGYIAVPRGAWSEWRADYYPGDRIEFFINGVKFYTGRNADATVGLWPGWSGEMVWGVGYYGGAMNVPIYGDQAQITAPGTFGSTPAGGGGGSGVTPPPPPPVDSGTEGGLVRHVKSWQNRLTTPATTIPVATSVSGSLFSDAFTGTDGIIAQSDLPSTYWETEVDATIMRRSSNQAYFDGVNWARAWLRTDYGSHRCKFTLKTSSFTAGATNAFSGVKVWPRRVPIGGWPGASVEPALYAIWIHAYDNNIYIQKKAQGTSTYNILASGTYSRVLGQTDTIEYEINDLANGNVQIRLWINNVLKLTGLDTGAVGGAPITAPGRPGIRGDDVVFYVDDYSIDPLDIQTSDTMLAYVHATGAADPTITPPAGWTLVANSSAVVQTGAAYSRASWYSHIADGTEGTSFTFTSSQSGLHTAAITAWRGAATTPVNVALAQGNATPSRNVTCPSVKTTIDQCTLLFGGALLNGSQFTAPAGALKRAETYSGEASTDRALVVCSEALGVKGDTGPRLIVDANPFGRETEVSVGSSVALAPTGQASGGQVQHRASAYTLPATGGTSRTVDLPAGTINGDLLLMAVQSDFNQTIEPTMPAGWTLVQAQPCSTTRRLLVYRKIAASEGANYTLTWDTAQSGLHVVALSAFYGHDGTTPINVVASVERTGAAGTGSATYDAVSVTTSVANALLYVVKGNGNGSTHAFPVAMSERVDQRTGNSSSDRAIALATEPLGAAAATGVRTVTDENPYSLPHDGRPLITLAIAPSAGAPAADITPPATPTGLTATVS